MTYPLDQSPLYRLHSRTRLARQIFNMSRARLEGLAAAQGNYRSFVQMTGGKERAVSAPLPAIRSVHERLATLLNRIDQPDYLHSGRRGRSHVSNALVHQGTRAMVKLDIRRFYPSITRDRVWRFFAERLQCSSDVSALLAGLCTFEGSAPIGSPLSQVLAFHVVRPLLDELSLLASSANLRFTCYVDDLSFSGHAAGPKFLHDVERIVRRHGFEPHGGIHYRPEAPRLITGLLLTARGPRVPPRHLERIRDARQQLAEADSVETRISAMRALTGRLAAAAAIEPNFLYPTRQLTQELNRITAAKSASATAGHPAPHPHSQ